MPEIEAMLAHARDDAARAAIALAGTCGLRRNEIVRLTVGMIQPDGSGGYRLDFRGKFDKPRHVRLTDTARDALLPLLAGKGSTEKVYPWQKARVNLDFQLASRAAGGRDLSPHDLRRGFGREFLRAFGHSPRALAALRDIYGHEDVSETIYYVGLDQEAADEGMLAFSESVRRAQLAAAD